MSAAHATPAGIATEREPIPVAATEKPVRGRPRKWLDRDGDLEMRRLFPGRTRRTIVHGHLCATVLLRLRQLLGLPDAGPHDCSDLPAPFDWLVSPRWKRSLLVELARIDDAVGDDGELLLRLARNCCETRGSVKVMSERVRQLRLGLVDDYSQLEASQTQEPVPGGDDATSEGQA